MTLRVAAAATVEEVSAIVESARGTTAGDGVGWLATGDCCTVGCCGRFVAVVVVEVIAAGGVRRGVGKITGVTATTIAVRSSAIKSLLSIYGTGS